MLKITVQIEGMQCGMCEAHVNDAIRNAIKVKKVASSHSTGQTLILAEKAIDEEQLKKAVGATGYRVLSVQSEPYEKKGFSLFLKF